MERKWRLLNLVGFLAVVALVWPQTASTTTPSYRVKASALNGHQAQFKNIPAWVYQPPTGYDVVLRLSFLKTSPWNQLSQTMALGLNGKTIRHRNHLNPRQYCRWFNGQKSWVSWVALNELMADETQGLTEWIRINHKKQAMTIWLPKEFAQYLETAELILVPASAIRPRTGAPSTIMDSISPSETETVSRSIGFKFHATQSGSYFACSLDHGRFRRCQSPVAYKNLKRGKHLFRVYAYSRYGKGPVLSHGFNVLKKPASVEIVNFSPSQSPTKLNEITVSFKTTHPTKTFCQLNSQTPARCVSPVSLRGISEGLNEFRVSINRRGILTTEDSHSWVVDLTPPQLAWSETPAALTSAAEARFNATISEIAKTLCSLDGQEFSPCALPVSLEELASGEHTFSVKAVDDAGNESLPLTYGWAIEHSVPLLTFQMISPASSPSAQKNAQFSFSANRAATFQCQLDQNEWTQCQSPLSLENLSDGNHSLAVFAKDSLGLMSETAQASWVIDSSTVSPSLTLLSPLSSPSRLDSAALEFSSPEAISYLCQYQNETATPCTSPLNLNQLSEGAHLVAIYAQDALGNTSAPASVSWVTDYQAPVLQWESRSPESSRTTENSANFSFTANETSRFFCRINEAEAADCASPISLNSLMDGTHRVEVIAEDAAGNQSDTLLHTWVVDSIAPTLTITAISPIATLTASRTLDLSFTTSEPALVKCQLDGNGYIPCSSVWQLSELTNGSHTVEMYAQDQVGLQSPVSSYTWTVSYEKPTVQITSITPNTPMINTRSLTVHFTGLNAHSFRCTMDGSSQPCTSPIEYHDIADGSHEFKVESISVTGVLSDPMTYSFVVDLEVPVIQFTSLDPSSSITQKSYMHAGFMSTSGEPLSYVCQLDAQPAAACTAPFRTYGLTNGAHSLEIIGVDAAGNLSNPIAFFWTVDTNTPILDVYNINPATAISNQSSRSFQFGANELSSFFCSLDAQTEQACNSGYTVSGLADGNHSVTIYAKDAAGNLSAPFTHSWMIDTQAPLLTLTNLIPSFSPTSSATQSISYSASPDAIVTCTLDGMALPNCGSPLVLQELNSQSHTVTFQLSDAAGNLGSPVSYTWVVNTDALSVSQVSVSNITQNSALITWTTNLPASSRIDYSSSADSGSVNDGTLTTQHSMTLTGLTPFAFYTLNLSSADLDGRTATGITTFRTLR